MKSSRNDFYVFYRKIARRFFGSALASVAVVIALYLFLWKERFGGWLVSVIEFIGQMDHEEAFLFLPLQFQRL